MEPVIELIAKYQRTQTLWTENSYLLSTHTQHTYGQCLPEMLSRVGWWWQGVLCLLSSTPQLVFIFLRIYIYLYILQVINQLFLVLSSPSWLFCVSDYYWSTITVAMFFFSALYTGSAKCGKWFLECLLSWTDFWRFLFPSLVESICYCFF